MSLLDPKPSGDDMAASSPALSGQLDARHEDGASAAPTPPIGFNTKRESRLDVGPGLRYELRSVLGIGGMGRVHLAWDKRLDREIAIKEVARQRISSGPDQARPLSETSLSLLEARLEREACITARLEHPGIVPVYDAGRTTGGELFYAMRVIRGRSLADALRDTAALDDRMRLLRHVRDACEAVAWAHRHGVVHRDLKPANIMVGEFGETQVVDWGLARLHRETHDLDHAADDGPDDEPLSDDMPLTMVGSTIGTPQYLSPEQAAGRTATPRSDVWSLGLVLFEVLAGRRAYAESSPSRVLAEVLAGPPKPLTTVDPRIPPELAAIVRRATALRDTDRYPDAKAMADDLTAWLEGRRVTAHTYSSMELLRRLVRAWRGPIIVGAIAFAALTAVIAVAFVETNAARMNAESESERALAAEASTHAALVRADTARASADRALSRLLLAEAHSRLSNDAAPEAEVMAARVLAHAMNPEAAGIIATVRAMPRPTRIADIPLPACMEGALAPDGTIMLCRDLDRLSLWDIDLDTGLLPALRWSRPIATSSAVLLPSAGIVAYVTYDHLHLVDIATGRQNGAIPNNANHAFLATTPNATAFFGTTSRGQRIDAHTRQATPHDFCTDPTYERSNVADDAGRFAMVCANADTRSNHSDRPLLRTGTVHFIDTDGSSRLLTLDPRALANDAFGDPPAADWAPSAVALIDDGRRLVIAGQNGRLAVIDTATGHTLVHADTDGTRIIDINISADNTLAAVRDERGGARLFDLTSGQWLTRLPGPPPRGMRFILSAPRRLAVWTHDVARNDGSQRLALWDIPVSPTFRATMPGGVTNIELADPLIAVSGTGFVRLFDKTMALLGTRAFKRVVKDLAISPDRTEIAIAAMDVDAAQTFSIPTISPIASAPTLHTHRGLVWLANDLIAIAPFVDGLLLWKGTAATWLHTEAFNIRAITAPSGASFAAIVRHDAPELWRLSVAPAPTIHRVSSDIHCNTADITRDGEQLACLSRHHITLLDPEGHERLILVGDHRVPMTSVAFSPAGDFLAAGNIEGGVHLWSLPDGVLRARFGNHAERVSSLVFLTSPNDGAAHTLITGSWDRTMRWHDLGHLRRDPAELRSEAETQWGLDVDSIIARSND